MGRTKSLLPGVESLEGSDGTSLAGITDASRLPIRLETFPSSVDGGGLSATIVLSAGRGWELSWGC